MQNSKNGSFRGEGISESPEFRITTTGGNYRCNKNVTKMLASFNEQGQDSEQRQQRGIQVQNIQISGMDALRTDSCENMRELINQA